MDNSLFKKVYSPWEDRSSPIAEDRNDMPENQEAQREHTYLVQCWVHPASGMDVVEKNRTMDEFKYFLIHVFHDDRVLSDGLAAFEKEVDGYVLRPFFFKSFDVVSDPEAEFLPRIHLTNPEARYASCQEIPNSK